MGTNRWSGNFTVQGFQEDGVNIGDRFRIGGAVVMVTEPRTPCYKLAVKFERDDIVKRLLVSRRTGFYLRVLQEGTIEMGDQIDLLRAYPKSDESSILAPSMA
jgi:MOSC domain-containing protein YiiM